MLYKVFLCENCQRQDLVVRHTLACLFMRKGLVGTFDPFYVKIWWILAQPLSKRRFSIYFRSLAPLHSPISASEKVQLTLLGSPLRAFQ